MDVERKNLGWGNDLVRSYTCSASDQEVQKQLNDLDVLIAGSFPERQTKEYGKKAKLFFRYSERILKTGNSLLKYPKRFFHWHACNPPWRKAYMLCASAYTAGDYAKFGLFHNRCYKWGYFPETIRYPSIDDLIDRKAKATILWCGRFLDWKHPDDVIEVAKRLHEAGCCFTIEMIGTGEMEQQLKRQASEAGLLDENVRFLGAMSPEASSNAKRFLEDMGVNIILQKRVVDYKDGNVFLDDGQTIPTRTLLWVSGVKAVHFDHIEGELLTRGERIIVNECNQVKGLSNIFAIGDVCWMAEPDYPNGHPQVAQVAIQQGELLAENLQRIEALKKPRPFHYKNLGTLATVGRNKAVADLNKVKLHGFTAWLVWMLVHLRSILGIKNKLIVLIDWIWNYFTYDRSMRFILFIQKHKQDGTQGTEPTL